MELLDNKYKVQKELGEGGFGKVFLAKEDISNRLVAIKQLINVEEKDQTDIIHEIKMIAKLDHPNIVTYYHHFWQDSYLFLVMEYCEGGNLREKMKNELVSQTAIFSWFKSLTSCLRIIHNKGIVHHDIKPDNILFSGNGTIKISDFGVANKNIGTKWYLSPEALSYDKDNSTDPKIDIYALGVTLMEVLTGTNPFFSLSIDNILRKHDTADFPIKELTNWQQELILKSINKVPELRFQFMVEFQEAIESKHVPNIFSKEVVKATELASYAEKKLNSNKWYSALKFLELAEKKYPNNISVLQLLGKFYLRAQQIDKAKIYFEKALKINRRLDLQKELGRIKLENENYPLAMGLLSDHLHRHPSDYEAYNLLIQCYYETERYEQALVLTNMLIESNCDKPCFINNYFISYALENNGKAPFSKVKVSQYNSPFLDYNYSVLKDKKTSWDIDESPTLKSKLLFMDYSFNKMKENTISFLDCDNNDMQHESNSEPIIKFGRQGYDCNDHCVPGGTSISRRHCLIINVKNNSWVYDLDSTGTYLNDTRVLRKSPLIGYNKLTVGHTDFTFNTDNSKLL